MTVWSKKKPPPEPPKPAPVVPGWSAKEQATLEALEAQRAEYKAKHDAWIAHHRKPLDEWLAPEVDYDACIGLGISISTFEISRHSSRKGAVDLLLKDPAKAIRLLRPFLPECDCKDL